MNPYAIPILETYARATDDQVTRGRLWYPTLRAVCERLAETTGYSVEQTAAVVAVTSPDAQLATNVRWAVESLENGGKTAGRYPKDQIPKIRAILRDTKDPGQYVSGPKVRAFYAAILGDESALCLDRWAFYAATGNRKVGKRERRDVETAYREAARIVRETPRDFQAIIWIVVRENTPDIRGRIRKMQDIAEIAQAIA